MRPQDFNRLLLKYSLGFVAALFLSFSSYLIVTARVFESSGATMAVILFLAGLQLVVQLYCFLHLRVSGRAAGRTVTFIFTGFMMLIIVIGSIWIMKNLDYRMSMSGEAMNEYMKAQNKKGF